MDYKLFLSSGTIGKLKLKNRSVFPPMGTGIADNDGTINDRLIQYHVRRVKGGCAMNIVEISAVHRSTENRKTINIYDDKFIPGLALLAGAIKDAGGKACIQLWHGGRQISRARFKDHPWAPSAIPCPFIRQMPHSMTKREILEVISGYGDAALRAKKAGFDAVEIHGAHGYLIDCFLNECSNTRTDEYGGSFENRVRFAIEVIADVRSKVGQDFPVIFRMSATEQVDGGIVLEDSIAAAKLYEAAGVDALDVSNGCYGAMHYAVPPYFMNIKTNASNAQQIKKNVNIPIIVAGRITSPEMAEEILQDGSADFISIGRSQLADPDFVEKTIEGREYEIIRCISCNQGCINRVFEGSSASCIFNPATGYEREVLITPAEKQKKVLVIGGGPGGLEAARVAKERGHDVVLFEKSGKLGGQFLLAGVAPHKSQFAEAAIHMGYRAQRAGVDIRLYTEATSDRLKVINPDVVIVATGSETSIPPIPGIRNPNVYDARSVISGEKLIYADNVVVIGGGPVGLEVMEILSGQGKNIAAVEMREGIGLDIGVFNKAYVDGLIAKENITVYTNSECIEIGENYVLLDKDGKTIKLDCDAVINAVGAKSNSQVKDIVTILGYECHIIGDAFKPAGALEAIWEGNEIARKI